MLTGQKMSSLVGSSHSYGAINSDNEDVQVTTKHGGRSTGYLITSDDSGHLIVNYNKRLKPHEKCCRIVTFAICILLFLIAGGGFTVLTLFPKGHSQVDTIQDSVATLLTQLDSYYFDVKVTKLSSNNDTNVRCNVSIATCSNIETYSKIHNGTGSGHEAIGDVNQQLIGLNPFAYLVTGSLVHVNVNVTHFVHTNSRSNKSIFLYVFTDHGSYETFGKVQNTPKSYFKRFDVSSLLNHTTKITFPVTMTGSYYYGLSLPNGTNYIYSYNIQGVHYNITNSDAKCELSSKTTSCTLHLYADYYSEEQCVLCYCMGGLSNATYTMETQLIRKPVTSISASILSVMVVMLIIMFSILLYDTYRRYLDPKISTWDTCICKCKCKK